MFGLRKKIMKGLGKVEDCVLDRIGLMAERLVVNDVIIREEL